MARMMTIYVDFNEHNYMVLVIVHQKNGRDQFCELSFVDEDPNVILANKMLVFDMKDGLKASNYPLDQFAGKLVAKTIEALQGRLNHGCIKHG